MINSLGKYKILLLLLTPMPASAIEVDLVEFDKDLKNFYQTNSAELDGPELHLLNALESVADEIRNTSLSPREIRQALTILQSTELIEKDFPKEAKISFADDFLVGSNLSIADLSNASFFLNSLNAKQLEDLRSIDSLASQGGSQFEELQTRLIEAGRFNPARLIENLVNSPEIDLVQVSMALENASGQLGQATAQVQNNLTDAISNSTKDLQTAAGAVQSATDTLSYAAGQAMAQASYSLDQAAQAISDTISAGVSVNLESAAQGLGYNSFSEAVSAYNEQYGTNYTVETAKEALNQ